VLDDDSRYATVPRATHTTPAGREIVYVTRRFLPRGSDLTPLGRVLVGEGDRLDRIASDTLGDPQLWWRVADANDVLNPDDLVRRPGTVLLISTER
jgi:hypothetical protein